MKILIINGPNLNMLGTRRPDVYGSDTLQRIIDDTALAVDGKAEITAFQSNSEGELITAIQQARGVCDGLIINAGAYSHYSYAIRDAIEAAEVPTVEVHLSNIHKRDEFRHKSVLSEVCDGVICGLGKHGYAFAALYLINKLTN